MAGELFDHLPNWSFPFTLLPRLGHHRVLELGRRLRLTTTLHFHFSSLNLTCG